MSNFDLDDNEQWAPVSDLMAGLMLIFMFIAIISVRVIVVKPNQEVIEQQAEQVKNVQVEEVEEKSVLDKIKSQIEKQANTFQEECDNIYYELHTEFVDDFHVWKAKLLPNLTIRFNNPKVLFESGAEEIRPEFQNILNDFFPRYMNKVDEFRHDIREIRIEGHTSSKFLDAKNEQEAYIKNMKLSQDRTRAILGFVLNIDESDSWKKWARPLITANGLSSSKLVDGNGDAIVDNNGIENEVLSRRVDFRLLATSCEKAQNIRDIP